MPQPKGGAVSLDEYRALQENQQNQNPKGNTNG